MYYIWKYCEPLISSNKDQPSLLMKNYRDTLWTSPQIKEGVGLFPVMGSI